MLQILGIGNSVGQTRLAKSDFEVLLASSLDFAAGRTSLGVDEFRYSSLSRDYLLRTKNVDIEGVREEGNQSPTDLGVAAALKALEAAAIKPEQLNLVIGECPTPWQSTPSEGQRIADRLGLKIPAYDIAGGGVIPRQLNVLQQWRRDRLPEYTLLVSTATPTGRIQFELSDDKHGTAGEVKWQFSDAAIAIVISARHTGNFAVLDTAASFHGQLLSETRSEKRGATREPSASGFLPLLLDAYSPLECDLKRLVEDIERLTDEVTARAIFKNKLHGHKLFFACGEAAPGMASRIAKRHDIAHVAETYSLLGQVFGGGSLHGLLANWSNGDSAVKHRLPAKVFQAGDRIILAEAVPGYVSGYAVIEAVVSS